MDKREVVRFEGDVASFTLMSDIYSNRHHIRHAKRHQIVYVMMVYVSSVLVAMAVAVILVTCLNGHRIVARNLWRFNRVWVDRPLLFLRGLTAVLMLSLTQVALEGHAPVTALQFTPRSTLATMVVAGEASLFPSNPAYTGLMAWTSRGGSCGQALIMEFQRMKDAVLIAAAAAKLERATNEDIALDCANEATPRARQDTNVGRRCLCGRGTVAAVDDPIRPARRRGALELFTTPLFDPQDPSFHMFDWMVLSDWATDVREVVRFDGDVSVLHVITEFQSPVSQAINYHEGPTTFAMYARTGVVYVTGALLGVTGLNIHQSSDFPGTENGLCQTKSVTTKWATWWSRRSSNIAVLKRQTEVTPRSSSSGRPIQTMPTTQFSSSRLELSTWLQLTKTPPHALPTDSFLLSSRAKYLFARDDRLHENHVYCIDPVSALLNGLVSYRRKYHILVMDIKLWRGVRLAPRQESSRDIFETPPFAWVDTLKLRNFVN
ncbi:hypothetical protein DYB28_001810 [Aphanomyces astaci]|uniref:Transmembrane protein n=1 Tax=Aphanomyces astaci TaxID=112090 RepID=A0A9X8E620_APHAT|nr:hypothetical protein DYB28_001810 [Aphanomyces astaci]